MNNFLKKLAGFSLGPVIGAVISLITIPLTTYFISPSEFGKSSMFLMTLPLLNIILYLGMDQSFAREYHEEQNKEALFFNAIIIPIVFSCFLCLIFFLFRFKISSFLFGTDEFYLVSIILGLMLIFSVFERFILMRLRMEEKALEYSLFSIFVKLTVLIMLIILLFFREKNFLIVVYSTIIGQIMGDIYLIYRYKTFFGYFSTINLDRTLIKKMLIFGFPLLIAVSLTSFLNTLGTYSIRNWSNFYELGIFSAGQRIANFLNIIQIAFTSFWVPTAYRWHKQERDINNFKFISDALLMLMTIGYFFVILFKDYITVLLSKDYYETKYIIGFLILVPILYTLSETTTLGIVFSKKSYLNIYISFLSVITCYGLNFTLVPKIGNKGAAIAIAIAYFVFYSLRTYFSKKNGFSFSTLKHYLTILLLFFSSMINMYDFKFINFCNILLLGIALIIQKSTIEELLWYKTNTDKYNFS
ncbi:oligosaccharide flippase family protein [Vagococcus fluvialis]|uniref:lipopolysaccharide biosynthesis protein n=1 Tax=Vagococcus fluvialis TaxID=2738 RepID=UPI0032E459C1